MVFVLTKDNMQPSVYGIYWKDIYEGSTTSRWVLYLQ